MPEQSSAAPESLFEKFKNNAFLMKEERFDELTKDERDWGPSALYLFIASAILVVLTTALQSFLMVSNPAYAQFDGGTVVAIVLLSIVFSLFFYFVLTYVGAGICYVLLRIFGGTANLLKTVQATIYGGTPVFLFGWIPFIGLFALLLGIVNVVIGYKKLHGIPYWKVVVAVIIIPLAVFAVLMLLLVAYFVSVFTGVVPVSG
ncbi:MAG: YIP1 family protein [Candidatus Bilamarchaeaceae archaeon]